MSAVASQPPASATDHNFSSPRYRANFAGESDIRTTDARADRWPPLAKLTPLSRSYFRSAEMLGPVLDALTSAYKKYED